MIITVGGTKITKNENVLCDSSQSYIMFQIYLVDSLKNLDFKNLLKFKFSLWLNGGELF